MKIKIQELIRGDDRFEDLVVDWYKFEWAIVETDDIATIREAHVKKTIFDSGEIEGPFVRATFKNEKPNHGILHNYEKVHYYKAKLEDFMGPVPPMISPT